MKTPFENLSDLHGKNLYDLDFPLRHHLAYFGNDFGDLKKLGKYAGTELYELAEYVDRISPPMLITWSKLGQRIDRVWINPAETQALYRLSREFGINRFPYIEGGWEKHFASI